MATVLQPIVNELNTVLVQLRTELRGLQTDADGAGIAIETRSDSAFQDTPHKMVSKIKLDNTGEWSRECAKWQAMVNEHGFGCVYSCPDRKESNAHVERSCGIVEVVMKSLLYEANLPPSWWERAAGVAEFLLDRFPVTSQEVSVPMDGDRARPLDTSWWI